jgi:hypothetical protein
MKRLLLAGLLIAVAFAADAGNYTCQIDHSAMYATGKTKIDPATGTLLWEYKCPMGHTYWIAPMAPNANSPAPPPQPPVDYSWLNNAGKQAAEGTGKQLAQIIGGAVHKPKAVAIILTVKCNMYVESKMVFDNGTTNVMRLNPSPASDANLATVQAAFPNLLVDVDDAGCSP